jgi:hypothetical protein
MMTEFLRDSLPTAVSSGNPLPVLEVYFSIMQVTS